MKKLQAQRDLLRDALQDLDQELKKLRASKKELEQNLRADSGKFNTVKEQESRLRNLMTLFMKKEDILLQKKTKAKEKLEAVSKKIDKVKTVQRELQGL